MNSPLLKKLIFSTVACSCFLCVYAAERSIRSLPRNATYKDEYTGVTFPADISDFRKTKVDINLNPVFGTAVRYSDDFGASADIYIYSLDTSETKVDMKLSERHFREVKNFIMNMAMKKGPVSEINLGSSYLLKSNDKVCGWRCTFEIIMSEEKYRSELMIFPFKGKIIKLRVSSPADMERSEKSSSDFMLRTFKIFTGDDASFELLDDAPAKAADSDSSKRESSDS